MIDVADSEYTGPGERLGAHDYLAKPLEPAAVIQAATSAYEHKQWTLRRADPLPRAFATTGARQPIHTA